MKKPKSPPPAMSGTLPSRISAKDFQNHVLGQLPQFGGVPVSEPKPQLRLKKLAADPMNANERRLLKVLQEKHKGSKIDFETLSFRLPSGTVYTPDFVVTKGAEIVALYEAKDSYLNKSARDSKSKFKEARAAFPQWKWVFAQWSKDHGRYGFTE